MKSKTWVKYFIKVLLSVTALVAAFNYIVDPFQQYRISDWYEITSKEQRFTTPGLAKNSSYQTVLIGSSMAENFQTSYINKELNTSSLKLCMAGMTAHEMHQLLSIVFKYNPDIKHIILNLDVYSLSGSETHVRNEKLPLYLFDDNYLNDFFYLLNKETLRYSFKMLPLHVHHKTDYDRMWYWGDKYKFSEKAVLRSHHNDNFNASFQTAQYKYDVLKKSFDYNILPFIQNNPHVTFHLLYPPYSYLTYQDMQNKKWLKETFLFKKYISTLNMPNLSVLDFQCITDITENLNNYKDIAHYSPSINQYMISSIKEKKHLSDLTNINDCLRIIQDSANKKLDLTGEETIVIQ